MTATERAIDWCRKNHILIGVDAMTLHGRGHCCSECQFVREAIADAEAAMKERCAREVERFKSIIDYPGWCSDMAAAVRAL